MDMLPGARWILTGWRCHLAAAACRASGMVAVNNKTCMQPNLRLEFAFGVCGWGLQAGFAVRVEDQVSGALQDLDSSRQVAKHAGSDKTSTYITGARLGSAHCYGVAELLMMVCNPIGKIIFLTECLTRCSITYRDRDPCD